MTNSLSDKLLNFRHSKLFSIIILLLSWFLLYQGYLWYITETTDNAYIEADISIVSSEINGVIDQVLVKQNTMVEKGQTIAHIDDTEFKAKYEQAVSQAQAAEREVQIFDSKIKLAKIEQTKAQDDYEFAEASYKVAEAEFKRTTELRREKFASMQRMDKSEIDFEKAKNAFSQSKLNLEMTAENLALLQVQRQAAISKHEMLMQDTVISERSLKNTSLKSPISGMVGNSSLRVGNYIRPGAPLFSIVPVNELYVKANFKETQIAKFYEGMAAEFTIDYKSGVKITGAIRNISPATGAKFSLLPPANATGNFTKIVQRVPVIIDFEIPEELRGKIVPGMSTIVKIKID